ncbi:protein rep [Actinomycetospora endophytica]|uniref:Protein rep n=1 Tax=Actinomycetospora endophytica TaxID=2291215 RepID=A0ABS8P4G7_9PSEU|nr:protein rep [Actinomycetospora endophytica]MCD2193155.1 protein rep [Actinomycetospora endophytica]
MNAEAGVTLGVIENKNGTRSAAYGGLKTCGSVWCCPVCAAKIATRRADDLATVMRAVDELGGSAFLLTLTMRHDRGDRLGLTSEERARRNRLEERLADVNVAEANGWDVDEHRAEADAIELDSIKAQEGCWDVLSYAWQRVTSGSSWQEDSGRFGGLLGWARAVEVTDGDNGWHVHLHVLLCFREQVSAEIARAVLGPRLFGRWSRALERKGFSASEEHGWDMRRAQLGDGDLADYFTKMAHEVTGGHRKEGRARGGRTPMQLLADAVETYEESAMARWWEWEEASDGRRQLTWSTGRRDLRALAELGREATDEEIADEDLDPESRLVLDADTWLWVGREQVQTKMLSLAESGGLNAVKTWLQDRGQRCTYLGRQDTPSVVPTLIRQAHWAQGPPPSGPIPECRR